jgi:hypothetical protein
VAPTVLPRLARALDGGMLVGSAAELARQRGVERLGLGRGRLAEVEAANAVLEARVHAAEAGRQEVAALRERVRAHREARAAHGRTLAELRERQEEVEEKLLACRLQSAEVEMQLHAAGASVAERTMTCLGLEEGGSGAGGAERPGGREQRGARTRGQGGGAELRAPAAALWAAAAAGPRAVGVAAVAGSPLSPPAAAAAAAAGQVRGGGPPASGQAAPPVPSRQ